jgi:hypothetical protein
VRKSTGYGAIGVLLLVAAEGLSYLALRIDNPAIQKRLYRPPAVSPEEFESYVERRDDVLGWPHHDWLAKYADAAGARLSPANERLRNEPVCVSTYGDSFTYGSDVEDGFAWGNVLATALGCRVINFGVPAYGMDQSILRFERNTEDHSGLVILGFYLLDMDRNMTQWYDLLLSRGDLSFKPRFRVDEQDELLLEPIRVNSYETMRRLIAKPADVLTAERYLPDGPSMHSKVWASFPYSWTLLRFARRVLGEIDPRHVSVSRSIDEWNYPDWFDSHDGPSPAKVELNVRLMRRFSRSCEARGQRCVVLVTPDADEIESHRVNQPNAVERVLRPMAREIEIWDPTGYFAEHSREHGSCHYFGAGRSLNAPS